MAPARVRLLIVGTPRSGTTLVQRLACELPGVAIPYETHFFTKGLDALRAEGAFPLDAAALRRGLSAYASLPHLDGAGLHVDAILDGVHSPAPGPLELFDAVVAALAGDAEVLGEKTPGHLPWAGALARARPELRVVAIVRDPRAAIASQRQVPWGGARVDVAAHRWLDDQRMLTSLTSELGPRLLLLRYEDVVDAPDAARAAIGALLARRESDGPPVAAGEGLRLPWEVWKESADAPITATRVDAWADTLGRTDADRIGMICAPELDRYGYGAVRPGRARGVWAMATLGRGARRRRRGVEHRRAALRAEVAATSLVDAVG